MVSTAELHKSEAPAVIGCAVITVSDTRTLETDIGGQELAGKLAAAGHCIVAREIIRDEPHPMRELLERCRGDAKIDAVLMTGGTGVSSRDQTFETVSQFLTKPLPGYGELFRMLSYEEIGPAAMLSRAIGGLAGNTVYLTMPGSPAAVRLALDRIILPELPHLVREARR